ncbi:hypothetical protein LCGC14_1178870 [marine sediment metagenome]|uniref:Uncharacterized protein n=1 Tax=marine sediment metagenome TaxID=412755 RepID=A0A0F9LSK9_9ZZZZ
MAVGLLVTDYHLLVTDYELRTCLPAGRLRVPGSWFLAPGSCLRTCRQAGHSSCPGASAAGGTWGGVAATGEGTGRGRASAPYQPRGAGAEEALDLPAALGALPDRRSGDLLELLEAVSATAALVFVGGHCRSRCLVPGNRPAAGTAAPRPAGTHTAYQKTPPGHKYPGHGIPRMRSVGFGKPTERFGGIYCIPENAHRPQMPGRGEQRSFPTGSLGG